MIFQAAIQQKETIVFVDFFENLSKGFNFKGNNSHLQDDIWFFPPVPPFGGVFFIDFLRFSTFQKTTKTKNR